MGIFRTSSGVSTIEPARKTVSFWSASTRPHAKSTSKTTFIGGFTRTTEARTWKDIWGTFLSVWCVPRRSTMAHRQTMTLTVVSVCTGRGGITLFPSCPLSCCCAAAAYAAGHAIDVAFAKARPPRRGLPPVRRVHPPACRGHCCVLRSPHSIQQPAASSLSMRIVQRGVQYSTSESCKSSPFKRVLQHKWRSHPQRMQDGMLWLTDRVFAIIGNDYT